MLLVPATNSCGYSMDLEVDAAGIHLVYSDDRPGSTNSVLKYISCPHTSDCTLQASWLYPVRVPRTYEYEDISASLAETISDLGEPIILFPR